MRELRDLSKSSMFAVSGKILAIASSFQEEIWRETPEIFD